MLIEIKDGEMKIDRKPITLADLNTIPIVEGQFIFCEDIEKWYINVHGSRIQLLSYQIETLNLVYKGGNYYEKK